MATVNAVLDSTGWVDIETATSVTLTDSQPYTLTIVGGARGEVCVAASTPEAGFIGHPVTSNDNFNYTHTSGDKVFVRTDTKGAILVLT